MPLLRLGNEDRLAACLDETGMVAVRDLDPAARLATMSEYGILVLQQRLVHHLTRVSMQLGRLREASIHVLEEVELQDDWIAELASPLGSETATEALARAARKFDEFTSASLEADGPSRRQALMDPIKRSAVRRAVQHEIRRLASPD